MIECRQCGANCDPGDIVGGLCDDCRDENRRMAEKQNQLSGLLNAESEQMRLEDFWDGWSMSPIPKGAEVPVCYDRGTAGKGLSDDAGVRILSILNVKEE